MQLNVILDILGMFAVTESRKKLSQTCNFKETRCPSDWRKCSLAQLKVKNNCLDNTNNIKVHVFSLFRKTHT